MKCQHSCNLITAMLTQSWGRNKLFLFSNQNDFKYSNVANKLKETFDISSHLFLSVVAEHRRRDISTCHVTNQGAPNGAITKRCG